MVDKVLVKILAYEGKHKIADKFEEAIYTVVSQPRQEIPVFTVKSSKDVEKTLHRNHLLPVEIGDTEGEIDSEAVGQRPKPKIRKSVDRSVDQHEDNKQEDASEDKGTTDVRPLQVSLDNKRDADSEFSDDDREYEYVPDTYIHGDAHVPTEDVQTEMVTEVEAATCEAVEDDVEASTGGDDQRVQTAVKEVYREAQNGTTAQARDRTDGGDGAGADDEKEDIPKTDKQGKDGGGHFNFSCRYNNRNGTKET